MAPSSNPPPPLKPQLIVGLGNPGSQYDGTRHNIGFEAIDALAYRWQISLTNHKKFQGIFGEGTAPGMARGTKIRLLKPTTFMNLSGQSIRAVLDWYKLPPESVLVVYDDMDLPLGRLRIRLSGSAGGHNGMKSTISHLGLQSFPRLRIGIGAPGSGATASKAAANQAAAKTGQGEAGSGSGPGAGSGSGAGSGKGGGDRGETVSHVLGRFAPAEQALVQEVLKLAVSATEVSLKDGIEKAMNLYNPQSVVGA